MIIKYSDLDKIMNQLANDLDIPDSYYEKANDRYKSLANWIERDNSGLRFYEPNLYLQGSFKLGTVVKPVYSELNYDVDIVCRFDGLSKNKITQERLKEIVGVEIKSYVNSNSMNNQPHNGKRCWTLNYHDEANFHMDILPCVADKDKYTSIMKQANFTSGYDDHGIAITDKMSAVYKLVSDDWYVSNPHGYYLWFKEKMNFIEKRALLAETYKMSVEEVPYYKVKTVLQKVIQLLKRHRDYMFVDDVANRPSSIIISTIVASLYNSRLSITGNLKYFADNVYSQIKIIDSNYYLPNPVNPLENFADRWNNNQKKKNAFDNWIKKLRKDVVIYDKDLKYYSGNYIDSLYDIYSTKKDNIEKYALTSDKLYIKHREKSKWPMKNVQTVIIKAEKKKDSFRYKVFKSGEVVSKGTNLKFTALTENIKYYDIHWQVTNTGEEARINNNLRGDFYTGKIEEGKRIRRENAEFKGSHFVECYIVKNGMCYGKSESFIVNINEMSVFDW